MSDARAWAAGVRVTVTGLSKDERLAVQDLVERAGGSYSSTLSKWNTHLIICNDVQAEGPISDKLAAAMAKKDSWQLQIVRLQWVFDSDQIKMRCNEKKYMLCIPERRQPLAVCSNNSTAIPPPPTAHIKTTAPASSTTASTIPTIAAPMVQPSVVPRLIPPTLQPSRDNQSCPEARKIEFTQAGFLPLKELLQKLDVADEADKANHDEASCEHSPMPPFPILSPVPNGASQELSSLISQLKSLPKQSAATPLASKRPSSSETAAVRADALLGSSSLQTADLQTTSPEKQSEECTENVITAPSIPSCSTISAPSMSISVSVPSNHGTFSGTAFSIDPSLSSQEYQELSSIIEAEGGVLCSPASLQREAVHVVCLPKDAARWLAMGVSVVSPSWVIQSARLGAQQRCLKLSADAARSLPQTGTSPLPPSAVKPGCPIHCTADATRPSADEDLQTEAARKNLLDSIIDGGTNDASGDFINGYSSVSVSTCTPASLLTRVNWAVTEPPHTARTESSSGATTTTTTMLYGVIPDSDEDIDDETLQVEMGISATQAAVADAIRDLAGGAHDHQHLQGIAEGYSQDHKVDPALYDVVIRGPRSLLLLLPTDGKAELAPSCRSIPLSKGCVTAYEILEHIYSFYEEELSLWQQVQLLIENPRAAVAVGVLRPAFLEGRAVQRRVLLGARCGLEGLVKATREPSGGVYEVRLLA